MVKGQQETGGVKLYPEWKVLEEYVRTWVAVHRQADLLKMIAMFGMACYREGEADGYLRAVEQKDKPGGPDVPEGLNTPRREITIADFLTPGEIAQAARAWKKWKEGQGSFAEWLASTMIRPNMDRINKALGQENDPMYLAYAVEYVLSQSPER